MTGERTSVGVVRYRAATSLSARSDGECSPQEASDVDIEPLMRVTSSGQYYIDVHDADGRTVESILLPQDSRYDQPTMDEGTHYYAKVYDTDQPPLVGIYRRTVTDGESVDHHWSSLEASWIRSAWLLPYAVGRGEEPLRAISERAAVYIIERLQVRTESLHLARVVGPGVYFLDVPDGDGVVGESVAFDADAPSASPSRESGVHYYAINYHLPNWAGPEIYRRTVVGHLVHDQTWSLKDRDWVDTPTLLTYEPGHDDTMLRAISERVATYVIDHRQAVYESDPWRLFLE